MSKDIQRELDSLKLETSAFKVVCYLSFKDSGLKPSDIAEGLEMNASTVRARLAELKDTGLISSTPDGYTSNLTPYDILMKLYRDMMGETRR